jgi:hypothetical protein
MWPDKRRLKQIIKRDRCITHQSVIKTTFLLYETAVSAIAGG